LTKWSLQYLTLSRLETNLHVNFLETQYCADTHTRTSTHPYEHTHTHPTPMSTFERLDRLNLRFTKSPWQYGRLIVCTFTNMLMSREQTFFMPNLSFDGLTAD
jgi:hypothetical protein